jgi:hypothetical protein
MNGHTRNAFTTPNLEFDLQPHFTGPESANRVNFKFDAPIKIPDLESQSLAPLRFEPIPRRISFYNGNIRLSAKFATEITGCQFMSFFAGVAAQSENRE